ncbi:MAG TPA: arginine--tRNA ligase [Pyrinomonadaceae bacterium]|nr:arginine--tRNA ligase [Pyrinomonadaceae bacterium]
MTLIELRALLDEKVKAAAESHFSVKLENIVAEVPPKTELGDLAFPVAFELAKQIKQQTGEKANPRAIGETLKSAIEGLPGVERVEVAGAGYLNIFFDRAEFLSQNVEDARTASTTERAKVCIEHTSVNPNKAAHIGHVRNSVLGDTFARILTSTGKSVEIQNYIDNTGVQVADVVVGLLYLEGRDLDSVKALDKELSADGKRFDHYCWDLYARVGKEFQTDETLKERRAEVLHALEEGGNPTAEFADFVATRNVECILETMERLSIYYDLLPRESEILHLHFWDKAFETMKELGVVRFESEGKHAGCWVMPFEEHSGTDEHEADKILVRSNGTVTYTGKDIAYQMWKLGILGLDFNYRPFRSDAGGEVWITTAEEGAPTHPQFGGGEKIYNVIDTRQSYPQEVVKKGVAAISPERGLSASVHLSYEMVALSPSAAEELGFKLSDDDRKRSFIEMSGRKGLGVKADDLIDRLEANAYAEVESRHPQESEGEKRHIAHQIAIGALRYFLLKFTRNTVIVFDFKEALSFEGETGCFCQYSAVRANSIFRKLAEKGESVDSLLPNLADRTKVNEVFAGEGGDEIWALVALASRLEETIFQAGNANEPAILAKYTFTLARAFNLFYHNHKILAEADETRRAVLVSAAHFGFRSLETALATLGIEVPAKM